MTAKGSRRRELAQLVPDHILSNEYRDMLLAVMYSDSQTHELGHDHGAAGPSFDRPARTFLLCLRNFGPQRMIHKGSFFYRTRHNYFFLLRMIIESVRLLLRVR
tara:strand:- start:26 stop:337 length:312 start_codon:yes stop_codon:yes gene_type:complete